MQKFRCGAVRPWAAANPARPILNLAVAKWRPEYSTLDLISIIKAVPKSARKAVFP